MHLFNATVLVPGIPPVTNEGKYKKSPAYRVLINVLIADKFYVLFPYLKENNLWLKWWYLYLTRFVVTFLR